MLVLITGGKLMVKLLGNSNYSMSKVFTHTSIIMNRQNNRNNLEVKNLIYILSKNKNSDSHFCYRHSKKQKKNIELWKSQTSNTQEMS